MTYIVSDEEWDNVVKSENSNNPLNNDINFKNMQKMNTIYDKFPNKDYILNELEKFLDKYNTNKFYLVVNNNKLSFFEESEFKHHYNDFIETQYHCKGNINERLQPFYDISTKHNNFHVYYIGKKIITNVVY